MEDVIIEFYKDDRKSVELEGEAVAEVDGVFFCFFRFKRCLL